MKTLARDACPWRCIDFAIEFPTDRIFSRKTFKSYVFFKLTRDDQLVCVDQLAPLISKNALE